MTSLSNKGNFTNHARSGNIDANWRKAVDNKKTTFKGNYSVVESRMYEKVTSLDVDTRQEYAKSLVAHHLGSSKQGIQLKLHKQTQTSTALDEVYYVKIFKRSWGKVSIRVQRTFKGTDLYFVLQKRVTGKKGGGLGTYRNSVVDPTVTKQQRNRERVRKSLRHKK